MPGIEMRKRVLRKNNPGILTNMANLALKFCNQGQWKDTKEQGMKTMEIKKNSRIETSLHAD